MEAARALGSQPQAGESQPQVGTEFLEMNCPWVESPFFEEIITKRNLSPSQTALARQYNQKGYIIIEDVASPNLVANILKDVAPLFQPEVKDGPRSSYRVQDAWKESTNVGQLANHPRVIETLKFLYEREPIPFQTLNFLHGSQQRAHSDAVHFSCLPEGFMCGVWVALEDVTLENGPVFYYPGSQRLPYYEFFEIGLYRGGEDYPRYELFLEQLMNLHGFKRELLEIRKGSALIWAANLVHGGSPIRMPGSTRHSQVTHFYFNDCIYYTPVHSNRVAGEYALKNIIDIRNGQKVPQSYNGSPVSAEDCGGVSRIAIGQIRKTDLVQQKYDLLQQLDVIKNSNAYKIGRAITLPIRKLKSLFS